MGVAVQRRVTIVDVARAAGVSASTASRVLNARGGDIRISDATRESVLQAAQRLGYRPNPFAAALRTQRTGVIGVIVRDLCDPFLNLLGRAVQQAARAQVMARQAGAGELLRQRPIAAGVERPQADVHALRLEARQDAHHVPFGAAQRQAAGHQQDAHRSLT